MMATNCGANTVLPLRTSLVHFCELLLMLHHRKALSTLFPIHKTASVSVIGRGERNGIASFALMTLAMGGYGNIRI